MSLTLYTKFPCCLIPSVDHWLRSLAVERGLRHAKSLPTGERLNYYYSGNLSTIKGNQIRITWLESFTMGEGK